MPKRSRPGHKAKESVRTSSDKKLGDRGYAARQVLSDRRLLNTIIRILMATLPLGDRPEKQQKKFILGILGAALNRSSLHGASKTFRNSLSGRRLREIAETLVFRKLRFACHKALQSGIKTILKGRNVDLAIDYTKVPYYGKPMKKISELFRRKGSRGTNNHHAYASVYVILRNRRFTLSILPLRQGASLVKIVLSLLRDAEYCGINTKRLFLDKEFCTVPIQNALQERRIPYCMAVKQTGKVKGVKAKVREHRRKTSRMKHTWKGLNGESSTADLYIIRRNARKGTGRTKTQFFTYAVWGFKLHPKEMRDLYRKRFGIESTYRMYNEVRGRTSSRNPALRYLYVIVAFVVLNQWALTKYAACAKKQRGPRTIIEDKLRLKKYVKMLSKALEEILGTVRYIIVDGELPKWYSNSVGSDG